MIFSIPFYFTSYFLYFLMFSISTINPYSTFSHLSRLFLHPHQALFYCLSLLQTFRIISFKHFQSFQVHLSPNIPTCLFYQIFSHSFTKSLSFNWTRLLLCKSFLFSNGFCLLLHFSSFSGLRPKSSFLFLRALSDFQRTNGFSVLDSAYSLFKCPDICKIYVCLQNLETSWKQTNKTVNRAKLAFGTGPADTSSSYRADYCQNERCECAYLATGEIGPWKSFETTSEFCSKKGHGSWLIGYFVRYSIKPTKIFTLKIIFSFEPRRFSRLVLQ